MSAAPFLRLRTAFVLLALVVASLFQIEARADSVSHILKGYVVVGDEVVLWLQTGRYTPPLIPSHGGGSAHDIEDWYIRQGFRGAALQRKPVIVGPLWPTRQTREPNPSAQLSPDGRLVWWATSTAGPGARELKIGPKSAVWQPTSEAVQIPNPTARDLPRNRSARLTTPSGRVIVQREASGEVHAYDLHQGKPLSDPWLVSVMERWLSDPDLHESELSLTEDLRYVVVWPKAEYQPHLRPVVVRSFRVNGKPYLRRDYALYFERGVEQPRLLDKRLRSRPEWELMNDSPFRSAVSIDGRLLLFYNPTGKFELAEPAGAVAYSGAAGADTSLMRPRRYWAAFTHDLGRAELVFTHLLSPKIIVTVWQYQDSKTVEHVVEYTPLFELAPFGKPKPTFPSLPVTK